MTFDKGFSMALSLVMVLSVILVLGMLGVWSIIIFGATEHVLGIIQN